MKRKRNATIELFRILLMFGIVLLHCVCQGAYSGGCLMYLLGLCVPGFIFISGWFGVSFSLSKVIRLYSVAIFASLLAPLVGGALRDGCYWREVLRVWDAPSGFWFIHAYVLLMMLSPLLNKCLEGVVIPEKRNEVVRSVLPLLFIVFGWSALLNYNHLRAIVPSPDGVTGHGFLCFMGVYVIGRYVRLCQLDRMIGFKTKLALIVVLIALSCLTKVYLLNGNTVLGVMLPVLLFLLIKDVPLPAWLARIILKISPLMFAVYCIHGTVYFPFTGARFFAVIEWTKQACANVEMPIPVIIFSAAVMAFSVGLFFAMIARISGILWSKAFPDFYDRIDACYDSLCARIAAIGPKAEEKS